MKSKNSVNGVYTWRVKGIIRYVGSGRDVLNSRKSCHLSKLRKGTHIPELQKLYDEYGEEFFEFVLLEECKVKDLFERERYYKDLYQDTIYNINEIKHTKKNIKTGLKAKKHKENFSKINSGVNNPNCSTEEDTVIKIKIAIRDGMKNKDIAKMFNKGTTYVSNIRREIRWKNLSIPDDYNNKENETTSTAMEIISGNDENIAIDTIIPQSQNELNNMEI